jgi:hypothetical protein
MKSIIFHVKSDKDLSFLQELAQRLQIDSLELSEDIVDEIIWQKSFEDKNKIQTLVKNAENEIKRGEAFDIEDICNQK